MFSPLLREETIYVSLSLSAHGQAPDENVPQKTTGPALRHIVNADAVKLGIQAASMQHVYVPSRPPKMFLNIQNNRIIVLFWFLSSC